MPRIILINPDYYNDIFSNSKMRAAITPGVTPLGLLCIASPLLNEGHKVKLLHLDLEKKPNEYLCTEIKDFEPDFIGITSATPLIRRAYEIASLAKKINNRIIIIAGGPHPSALPEDVLKESVIDCVIRGEGDLIFNLIVKNGLSLSIPNIYYKENGKLIKSQVQDNYIKDLDILPFPAYERLDIKKYFLPKISSRKEPLGNMETSRGCYSQCVFCNKNIHGYKVRKKSTMRVVDEMERMLRIGFREIHIIDDTFTADEKRAYEICEEIQRRGLNFPWYPRGGIRVDRVNLELLKIMKKSGCYRIPFGIESGSQRILDVIKKKITLEQAEEAVKLAKTAGLETECYFMIGHPTETEEDLEKSINFAIKLQPDYVKFAITIPLPGTPMFDTMSSKGQIKTRNWDKYNFSVSPKELYDHDTLSWDMIDKYYDDSHRRYYFRSEYIVKMIYKTILNGTFLGHIKAFLKTRW